MRRLMWFTVGFAAACAAGVYFAFGKWLIFLCVCCLLPLFALLRIHSKNARRAVCALVGMSVAFLWLWCFDTLYLDTARRQDGQSMLLEIEATDYSRPTQYGIAADGKTKIDGKTYAVQFYINEEISISPGDKIEGGFTLRYTGGGSVEPTYHRGKGIFLLCYPKGENTVALQQKIPAKYFPAVLRQKILSLLSEIFPEDAASFAKALLLGFTDELDNAETWSLKTSGVYHIVAVSGMHVSVLFALIYLLCFKNRGLTALLGFPVLLLFAAVTGFSPSVVRACIMQGLMILAMLVNREYDPPTALAAAVLLLLGSNPLQITSVSLQLSVGCMAGIFLFTQRIYRYILHRTPFASAKNKSIPARLARWAVASVSVTLGAISLTTPLSAAYFGAVSISGILTNLLLLWLIGIIFYGIIAACVLGALWLPLGIGLGWLFSQPIKLVLEVTDMISRLPVASVYTSSVYIVAWLIFVYVLLAVFLKTKKKHPVALACCILAGLLGAVACSWIEPRLDDYRITAVDVGQGQCLLLQSDGKRYMVDCGGDSGDDAAERATRLLLSQGIFRLDGLIITHYDADHAGGVLQLLSRIPAETVYLPAFDGENDLRDAIVEQYGEKIQQVTQDTVLQNGDITIYPSADTRDENESSLCILFQPEDCDILITGDRSFDGELELMNHTELPDLEILIAGHHGSRTSTSLELLNKTRPEIVIISVGAGNRYGHPTQETLERISLFGCNIYRTDLEGTIIFRG